MATSAKFASANCFSSRLRQNRPERYLDEDGATGEQKFSPSPYVLPFGVGRRRCLGESLAKVELYLFTCSILRHFSVEGYGRVRLHKEAGAFHRPRNNAVVFLPISSHT